MPVTPLQLTCSSITLRHLGLAEALDVIKDLGFESVDLGALVGLCEHVPPNGTDDELTRAAETVLASDLRPTSVNADPGSFNGGEASSIVLQRVERLLDFCVAAGVPRLVLTCGEPASSAPIANQIQVVAHGLELASKIAKTRGVELSVEAPHYFRLVNNLDRACELVSRLPEDVKQVWDVSHVRACAGDPNTFVDHLDRVSVIHLRDAVDGDIRRVIGAGDIDFGRFLGEVARVGFEGPVVLELETESSPFDSKEAEVLDALACFSEASLDVRPHATKEEQGRSA